MVWLYALPLLVIMSATIPPLLAVAIPLGFVLMARGRHMTGRRRAAERVILEHRRARLEAEQRRALILAWRSFS